MANVYESIADGAANRPDRVALVDSYGALTYRELLREAQRLSSRLEALGVERGKSIGLMLPNGRAFVIAACALLHLRAPIFLIPPNLRSMEFDSLRTEMPVDGLVSSILLPPPHRGKSYELALSDGPGLRYFPLDDRPAGGSPLVFNAAFVRSTSGTTDREKGVVMTHQDVIERTDAANETLRIDEGDTVIWVLPMAFHFVVSIVLYLRFGARIALADGPFAAGILDLANEHNATVLYASPLHYRLLNSDRSGKSLSSLRLAVSTSTALPEEIARTFLDRYKIPVCQAYGIIEVGLPLINVDAAREKPEAVGKPGPGYSVAFFDDDLVPVPHGEIGQLGLKGPGMFSTYLNPPRTRNDVLHDGWFLTGDIARQDAAGVVRILGRCKSMINVGGNKVFPEEVERVLTGHPAVRAARVERRAHPQMGEVPFARVVLAAHADAPDPETLLAYCRKRLSDYKIPHGIEFTDSITETLSGKVRR